MELSNSQGPPPIYSNGEGLQAQLDLAYLASMPVPAIALLFQLPIDLGGIRSRPDQRGACIPGQLLSIKVLRLGASLQLT